MFEFEVSFEVWMFQKKVQITSNARKTQVLVPNYRFTGCELTDDDIVDLVQTDKTNEENCDYALNTDNTEETTDSNASGGAQLVLPDHRDNSKALTCIEYLREYILTLENDFSEAIESLFNVENYINSNIKLKQQKIDDYFRN